MEYIKKENLIKYEIYTSENGNIVQYKYLNNINTVCGKHIGGHQLRFVSNLSIHEGCFSINKLKLSTPEEKHWLETSIQLDKFITFEEAMKTFVPEYVECIRPQNWKQSIKENDGNLIFKSDFKSTCIRQIKESCRNDNQSQFKLSTKEAYEAQFVVKEPEFVLPEKWCIKSNDEIEVKKVLEFKPIRDCEDSKCISFYRHFPALENICTCYFNIQSGYTEITFEQFKKYVLKEEKIIEEVKVIELLPQFKIIEIIETITKVENNEGNQFFIGDVVKSSNGTIQTIESFGYNKRKTNIIAFTNKQSVLNNGIGIDKIEHYIEPKVKVIDVKLPITGEICQNETLLEKAKRLYPIGTKVKTATGNNFEIIIKDQSKFKLDSDNNISVTENYMIYLYWNYENKWAKIIE